MLCSTQPPSVLTDSIAQLLRAQGSSNFSATKLDGLFLSFAKLMATCALDFIAEIDNAENRNAVAMKRQVREQTKQRVERALAVMKEQLVNPKHLYAIAAMIQERYVAQCEPPHVRSHHLAATKY
jgi:hypothetical protein